MKTDVHWHLLVSEINWSAIRKYSMFFFVVRTLMWSLLKNWAPPRQYKIQNWASTGGDFFFAARSSLHNGANSLINSHLLQKIVLNFWNIQLSHWCCEMVDGIEFWIVWQWLTFYSSLSRWQLIQNSAPITILRCPCNFHIRECHGHVTSEMVCLNCD